MYFHITEKKKIPKGAQSIILRAVIRVAQIYAAVIFFAVVVNIPDIYSAAKAGSACVNQARELKHILINRDFAGARVQAQMLDGSVRDLADAVNRMKMFNYIPIVRSHKIALDVLMETAVDASALGGEGLAFADELFSKIPNESITFATMSNEQKGEFVGLFLRKREWFTDVSRRVDALGGNLESIDTRFILPPFRGYIRSAQKQSHTARALAQSGRHFLDVFPRLASYGREARYLFLLQNNTELRPTGGFIGTVGIVTVKNGDLITFQTDNVYNLDLFVKDVLDSPAPTPIRTYVGQEQMLLRDSNWNPDFPATARFALSLFEEEQRLIAKYGRDTLAEGTPELEGIDPLIVSETIDGVVAVTPEVIQALLEITGPVTVEGIRFSADTVIDDLEYYIGRGYKTMGLSDASRKGILGSFADALQLKLMSVPYHEWSNAFTAIDRALESKSIMLYSRDADTQRAITAAGWDGRLGGNEGDFLGIIDTNLASLKTDPAIDRDVAYTVTETRGRLQAQLSLTYTHEGHFDWKTSRLRDYLRVYVPAGSALKSATGFTRNDRLQDPEQTAVFPDVYGENGYTVFGGFFSVEPQESHTVTFVYDLPESVRRGSADAYTLCVHKQPGVSTRDLTITLDMTHTVRADTPIQKRDGSRVTFTEENQQSDWCVYTR